MFIMIDDLRDIDDYVTALPENKLTLRTFQQGLDFVTYTNMSEITLFMDNDLDDPTPGNEGYDILNATIEMNNLPKCVVLVTANPVARERMQKLLVAADYKKRGHLFWREV